MLVEQKYNNILLSHSIVNTREQHVRLYSMCAIASVGAFEFICAFMLCQYACFVCVELFRGQKHPWASKAYTFTQTHTYTHEQSCP